MNRALLIVEGGEPKGDDPRVRDAFRTFLGDLIATLKGLEWTLGIRTGGGVCSTPRDYFLSVQTETEAQFIAVLIDSDAIVIDATCNAAKVASTGCGDRADAWDWT